MRKIALSGMKGRKKDTFLLSFVIILSFIFIITATIFHASSEETKLEQRIAMFGSWEAAYLDGNEDMQKKFLDTGDIDKLGVSRLLGKSSTLGTVGTINKELLDMGYFQMYEGRMPENDNEIALELNQLSYFPRDIKVGDTVPIEVAITISERPWEEAAKEQVYRVIPEIEERFAKSGIKVNIAEDMEKYDKWWEEASEKISQGIEIKEEDMPRNWFWDIYYRYARGYGRNEQSLESFNNTKVIIKTSYVQMFLPDWDNYDDIRRYTKLVRPIEEIDEIEEVPENIEIDPETLSMISQKAYITRNMVVSGIIQNYSDAWDIGDKPVANAFVTEEAGKLFIEEGFLQTKEIEVSDYKAPLNLFIGSNIGSKEFFNKYENKFEDLIRNTYAYPDITGSTEATLTYGILAAIFVATIFAVFQIYLTQTKRRTRRMALLKSIGGTNGQIAKILLWELMFLLIITIPISIILGVGISKFVLLLMNKYGNTVLNFHINYKLSTLGLGVGIFAVFIGMLLPMIMSMKVPLTGTISKPPKHKKIIVKGRTKQKSVDLDMRIQSFRKISIKNIRYNKGKYLLTASLYTITTTILLGSIFLCFIFFGDYIDNVIMTDKPSYGFELDYGMRKRAIPEFVEKIYDIEGVSRVELYKAGEHAYLWYEGIENNILFSTFKGLLPHSYIDEHFGINDLDYVNLNGDNKHLIEDAVVANIYGIDTEDTLYKKFENALTIGSLNKEKFESGKEVILMMPIYEKMESDDDSNTESLENIILNTEQKNRMGKLLKNSNKFNITYDFRYKDEYLKDNSISIGQKIHLTVPTENLEGDNKTNDVRFNEVTVAGIIYYFPEKGIWPFADTVENPVVVGSYNFIGDVYPSTVMGIGNMSPNQLRYLIERLMPTRYGKTWVYIYEDKKADDVEVGVNIKRIAREDSIKLNNYKEGNKKLFSKAFNISAIITILGISVAVITLIILYNTTLSKLEQERERIGTFQALGVTGQQFKKLYLFTGIGYGIVALVISHILLGIAALVTSLGIGRAEPLWLYPWNIHILVSIIIFIVTVMTYYLPIRKILGNQPIDNIRNLGR